MQKALLFSLLTAITYSQSAKNCGCKISDVTCLAKCFQLPDPTDDQSNKTNDCITTCTDNGGGDDCFNGCINQIFRDHQKNGQSSTGAPVQSPTPTTQPPTTISPSTTKKTTIFDASNTSTTSSNGASSSGSSSSASSDGSSSGSKASSTTRSSNSAQGSASIQPINSAKSSTAASALLVGLGFIASMFI
ncbi:hypothetical protein CONCODRAFT_77707 [Conidiobolus coronatus NRRL 28638]|uniref:Extracellular membrane protein CFEM domain-containing protein n=1 Tax=Conidiobolus coronatus (strain ATCC 28846 / CBS 209.66 / NRRL 28638) TaxID=796925 RepID=A0A137PBX7_CONC2|nr:hypothetical protein CONCODRAFT_77707 [Conidiobolus coronatus NRRL 28638]|eukprot:KXN72510.1 hypothetical protein CONCODRAFT_77707 [Conidiobolus coronatus NRRL 28638]